MTDLSGRAVWVYRRLSPDHELGFVRGRDVGLPFHFHAEDQLTFVLSGRRRFVLRQTCLSVTAGTAVILSAGVPHRSLSEPDDVVCVNTYLPSGLYDPDMLVAAFERHWRAFERLTEDDQKALLAMCAGTGTPCGAPRRALPEKRAVSREAFSRAFARSYGMPPYAFAVAKRLNRGRRMLQLGESLATAAIASGFADQSHFGRWFKRAFGTTPGRYRSGHMITSVPDARRSAL